MFLEPDYLSEHEHRVDSRDSRPQTMPAERKWKWNLQDPTQGLSQRRKESAAGARGAGRGRHARGPSRGPAWGSRGRAAPLPAPGPRARLTLQDDLLERLPLQPVPAPQFLRDVALPAGKVSGAEARRHAERCPGASRPPIRAATGNRGLRRAAGGGRRGPAAGTSPPLTGDP